METKIVKMRFKGLYPQFLIKGKLFTGIVNPGDEVPFTDKEAKNYEEHEDWEIVMESKTKPLQQTIQPIKGDELV